MTEKIFLIEDEFNLPVRLKDCHKEKEMEIVVIDDSIFEINGTKYRYKEPATKPKMSKSMLSIMAVASMFGDISGMGVGKRNRPTVNIIEEYKLIQLKQSKLSANDRSWVVRQFENDYVKV